MLGVVGQQCCVRLHRALLSFTTFFLEFVNNKSYVQTDATTLNIVAGNFAQQLPTTRNNMQQNATCNIQHCCVVPSADLSSPPPTTKRRVGTR